MIKANATDIEIFFEVVDVDEQQNAINFSIRIDFSPFMQRATYQIRNVMIDKEELLKFEEQLANEQIAELCDVNAQLVLQIEHTDECDKIEIQPLSTEVETEYDRLNITMYADHLIMGRLSQAFQKYPKWW